MHNKAILDGVSQISIIVGLKFSGRGIRGVPKLGTPYQVLPQ